MKATSIRVLSRFLLPVIYLMGLIGIVASGGGDGESETLAWVRIDEPVEGYSTGLDYVVVEGNAGMRDGSNAPDPIYWYNNGASGTLPSSTICLLGCIKAFRGQVPLFMGSNTISVEFYDGSDSVAVTRYPLVVAEGRVVIDDPIPFVRDVTITLSGGRDAITRTDDSGRYLFSSLKVGSYTVSASLTPPQSVECFSFSPENHVFEVITDDDISGLDFTATQLIPCYSISGYISYSTNPDAGVSEVKMTLKDTDNNEYIIYSNFNGDYNFSHLTPGTYTVTPSKCLPLFGCYTFEPATETVTITNENVTSLNFVGSYPTVP